ncbi:unnamed protein product, partial [Meganyctiphanes norvegica]
SLWPNGLRITSDQWGKKYLTGFARTMPSDLEGSIRHTASCLSEPTKLSLTHFRDLHKPRQHGAGGNGRRTPGDILRPILKQYDRLGNKTSLLSLIHLCNFSCPGSIKTSQTYLEENVAVNGENSNYLK